MINKVQNIGVQNPVKSRRFSPVNLDNPEAVAAVGESLLKHAFCIENRLGPNQCAGREFLLTRNILKYSGLNILISEAIIQDLNEHIKFDEKSPFKINLEGFSRKLYEVVGDLNLFRDENGQPVYDYDVLLGEDKQTFKDLIYQAVRYLNSEVGLNIKLVENDFLNTDDESIRFNNLELSSHVRPVVNPNNELEYHEVPSSDGRNLKWTHIQGLGYIPVLDGVMKARNSTASFVRLVNDNSDKLQGETVYQIGPSHGGITKALAEYAENVVAVDILDVAIRNTLETLKLLDEKKRAKVKLLLGDLALLKEEVKLSGKVKHLFFNCPIFRGTTDPNSTAGNDFELIKRTLKLLPDVLDVNGEAYLLVGYPESASGRKFLWTTDKLNNFLSKEMPDWTFSNLSQYESPYNDDHGTYGIVRINRKTTSS